MQEKNANVTKFAKFAKFQKFEVENLVDFEKWVINAYLLAKIGADTAENEPTLSDVTEIQRRSRTRRGASCAPCAQSWGRF